MRSLLLAAGVLVALFFVAPGSAAAYPQFQLSYDQTCTGCHISPAGGNQLNENGLAVAESMSQLGHRPEFFYGAIPTPDWLLLGGDVRSATGFMATPEKVLAYFPMQVELYADVKVGNFRIHTNFGPRPRQEGNEAATTVWAREHYLMWQQNADAGDGVFVRAGRFMPVFGLRLAEHPVYTRRYGGTQLYSETYGLNVSYVTPQYEAHVTGFIEDPLISPVEQRNGGAAYAEMRLSETLSIGGEGMYSRTDDDEKIHAGITGKVYLPDARLLLQGELQFINHRIDETATNPAGGAPHKLVGYLLGSLTLTDFLLLDVGLGHYDSNLRISELDRDCIDMNLHYFLDSHLEIVLNTRFEMMAFGKGGPSGGYSLIQLHYRL